MLYFSSLKPIITSMKSIKFSENELSFLIEQYTDELINAQKYVEQVKEILKKLGVSTKTEKLEPIEKLTKKEKRKERKQKEKVFIYRKFGRNRFNVYRLFRRLCRIRTCIC